MRCDGKKIASHPCSGGKQVEEGQKQKEKKRKRERVRDLKGDVIGKKDSERKKIRCGKVGVNESYLDVIGGLMEKDQR